MVRTRELLQFKEPLVQYGFERDSRRLQLTKTISLAQLFPIEMQQFREEGSLKFATTMEMFDRDHPGHYLRLIREVNVTVIALVPPVEGIKATLRHRGPSNVVTGGNLYQKKVIPGQPQTMVYSAAQSQPGVYSLQPNQEFLKPFEASGVEGSWEFIMEKPANPIDYNSIADVLVEIKYEALESSIYRSRVINELGTNLTDKFALSFKDNLPDQWFELHNAAETASLIEENNDNEEDNDINVDYETSFEVSLQDFAPNIVGEPQISRLSLYISVKEGFELSDGIRVSLMHTDGDNEQEQKVYLSEGSAEDGSNSYLLVFTEFTNTSSNSPSPVGLWTLKFIEGLEDVENALVEEKINDIIFMVEYNADSQDYLKNA